MQPPNPLEDEIRRQLDQKRYAEAFESVVAQYRTKVFGLAVSMLRDHALAEETAQEVFIRIWKALPGYRGLSSLSTWVYAIARNRCLTARQSNARDPVLSLDTPEVRCLAESRIPPPVDALRGPDLDLLVGQLPDRYREVLTLFYMEDKSYEEVASLLDLPMGTVKTYLHRARKQLAAAVMESSKITGGRR